MARDLFLRGAVRDYGKRPTRSGGTVLIRSRGRGPRRVSLAPDFDPNAISMTPIPGWMAVSVGARFRLGSGVDFRKAA